MKVPYILVFNAQGVLEKIYKTSTVGKVKYAIKRNLRKMSECIEDIREWLQADAQDNGWDINGSLPTSDSGFRERFEKFLKEESCEIEPYLIPERYTETFDGVTGEEESFISWLISPDDNN